MCNQQWHLTSSFMMDKQQLLALKITNENDKRVVGCIPSAKVNPTKYWSIFSLHQPTIVVKRSLVN